MQIKKIKVKPPDAGLKREVVKFYFYTQKGLSLCNEFRYLLMGIFAVYFSLKIDNILFIPIMFVIALPILIFLGWLAVNHVDRIIDYFNIKKATTYGRYGYELNERQLESLNEIVNLLTQIKKQSLKKKQ